MMVEARKDADKGTVADNAADMSRLAEATAKLCAEQASAMAVMTVYGIRAASEMTSMMLGALRGPTSAPETSEPVASQETAPVAAKVVPLRHRAAAPVVEAPVAEVVVAPVAKVKKAAAPKAPRVRAAAPKPVTGERAPAQAPLVGERDDLKKISGVGPRLEQVLNERGILRYAQLAGLSKAALKKLDGELGLDGRVTRDDWVGQARALSGGKG
jgi:NADH-quinone oxidoreductase subunit E